MNFKEAYEKMQEGKKVKRKDWEGRQYYSLIEDDIFFVDKLIVPNITVEDSLAEDWEIFEEPKIKDWEPKKGDKYYYIYHTGVIFYYGYNEDNMDKAIISMGNYFKTEEEAQHMVEKLKVIHELQKFAYENNENEIDWKNFDQYKYKIFYDIDDEEFCVDYGIYCKSEPFNIYFTSSKIAKKAIEAIGEDRIKKYYFDVEE